MRSRPLRTGTRCTRDRGTRAGSPIVRPAMALDAVRGVGGVVGVAGNLLVLRHSKASPLWTPTDAGLARTAGRTIGQSQLVTAEPPRGRRAAYDSDRTEVRVRIIDGSGTRSSPAAMARAPRSSGSIRSTSVRGSVRLCSQPRRDRSPDDGPGHDRAMAGAAGDRPSPRPNGPRLGRGCGDASADRDAHGFSR